MGSGMNLEQAKEYAKTMTYKQAVGNVCSSKGIKYRKATMIKLRELAEIADRLDHKTENCSEKPSNCDDCIWSVCNYNKVPWGKEEEPKTEPLDKDTNVRSKYDCDRYVVTNDEGERAYNCIGCEQTDCTWKKGEDDV